MIDNLGLKGLRAGNAMVSENHANVIQNLGGATASEVIDLERTIIDKVLVAYGIILRSEVVKLGEF
jgi:UDP-N-acetylmuramate dehydrogenase